MLCLESEPTEKARIEMGPDLNYSIYFCFVIYFGLGAIQGIAQGLFLTLHKVITGGSLRGPYKMTGDQILVGSTQEKHLTHCIITLTPTAQFMIIDYEMIENLHGVIVPGIDSAFLKASSLYPINLLTFLLKS